MIDVCESKRAFRSKAEAMKAIRGKQLYRPYRCDVCSLWHVGHTLMRRRWNKWK